MTSNKHYRVQMYRNIFLFLVPSLLFKICIVAPKLQYFFAKVYCTRTFSDLKQIIQTQIGLCSFASVDNCPTQVLNFYYCIYLSCFSTIEAVSLLAFTAIWRLFYEIEFLMGLLYYRQERRPLSSTFSVVLSVWLTPFCKGNDFCGNLALSKLCNITPPV